jgi:asparagine synthase (glutamine-hydrolysing)
MCGFAGLLCLDTDSSLDPNTQIAHMTSVLLHRGPDDSGVWTDPSARIALGHQRLSILDLSASGHQPMVSSCERFVIVFNGEIYNHQDLRNELIAQGVSPVWRGTSDTETLLAYIAHYGFERALQRTVGMFAMALWDRRERILSLARDRMGEKPLYYGWTGRGPVRAFVFGSELKALRAYEGFDSQVCRQALAQYLRFMYVPAPRSIYAGIFKLEPGCLLTIQEAPPIAFPSEPVRPGQAYGNLRVQRWWSLAESVSRGALDPIEDEAQALQELQARLEQSIELQSLADVPVGAFLSGGIDSSTVVALMQRQASRPVKTFTIGFDEQGFDESPYAAAVARHLGTDHHETRVTSNMAQAILPTLPHIYDEPFADSSQIPTLLVCRAARAKVTVALSGDSGDELFGGYSRYFWGPRVWHRLSWMPLTVRKAIGTSAVLVPPRLWDGFGNLVGSQFAVGKLQRLGEKVHRLAHRLKTVENIDDLYLSLVSEWSDPTRLLMDGPQGGAVEPESLLSDPLPTAGADHEQSRMMFRDSMTYLPDDILCKVDRAAMASSLECRVPFLDHRIVELACRLPLRMKIRQGVGKWALRQVLYKHVPKHLMERPKAGFAVPIGEWLRGPLKDWAEDLLDPVRLDGEGYFQSALIYETWKQHLSRRFDHSAKLWSILMFQSWLTSQSNSARPLSQIR